MKLLSRPLNHGLAVLIFSALTGLLSACATNMLNQFERIHVGMEKEDVLSLLDSPQRTQRWKSQDRWTYIFYSDRTRYEKEVHFENGKAVYVGNHPSPPISAESKDLKIEQENAELEKVLQQRAELNQNTFPKYEQQIKGEDEKIRYVPQFTPLQ